MYCVHVRFFRCLYLSIYSYACSWPSRLQFKTSRLLQSSFKTSRLHLHHYVEGIDIITFEDFIKSLTMVNFEDFTAICTTTTSCCQQPKVHQFHSILWEEGVNNIFSKCDRAVGWGARLQYHLLAMVWPSPPAQGSESTGTLLLSLFTQGGARVLHVSVCPCSHLPHIWNSFKLIFFTGQYLAPATEFSLNRMQDFKTVFKRFQIHSYLDYKFEDFNQTSTINSEIIYRSSAAAFFFFFKVGNRYACTACILIIYLFIFNFYSRIHAISFLQSKFQDFKHITTTFKDFVYITALEDNDLIMFLDVNQMRGLQASVIEKDRRLQASNSNQSDISSLSFLSGWLDGMVVGHAAHRLHACVRGFLTCTCFSSMGSPYLGL